jgi:two-component system chemotaxis sensor kinase CheA
MPVSDGPETSEAGVEPELQGVLSASDTPSSTMFETLTPGWEKELLPDFLVEARDHIATAEAAILLLEVNPDDMQSIHTVLRAFHTIKGSAGLVRLPQIQALAHQTESLLIQARDGKVQMARKNIGLTLQACDAIKLMLDQVETTPTTESAATTESVQKLQTALSEAGGPEAPVRMAVPPTPPTVVAKDIPSAPRAAAPSNKPAISGKAIPPKQAATPKKAEEPEIVTVSCKPIEHDPSEAAKNAAIPQSSFPMAPVGDVTIRVDTGRLDELVNSVGELVIAHSILAQNVSAVDGDHGQLLRNVAHSGKIIRQLQDLALSLRMVPFKGTFHKMSRLVRDLSLKSGKSVYLHLSGEDTEIDRNMVQALNDPLMHMIRNAVDHGIESAEERVRSGKGPVSELHLRAYHAGGNVVVELEDDGKGLDRERIIRKAVEHGLIEPGRELSDDEAYTLIFHPGLSTADQVTDVSGRGVGLDVVRRNIESLRGHIAVNTRPGLGTIFTLRVPLTLAILDAMLVRVGRQQYLLPTVAIQRSFRPEPGSVSRVAGRAEMVMLHEELYPLFRLHKLFNVDGAVTDPEHAMVLVIEGANKRCALLVDAILGQQQAVIKSLGNALSDVQGVVGGAILGNGRVGIILDVVGLVQLAHGQTHGATSSPAS